MGVREKPPLEKRGSFVARYRRLVQGGHPVRNRNGTRRV